jgi:hypothetical protein
MMANNSVNNPNPVNSQGGQEPGGMNWREQRDEYRRHRREARRRDPWHGLFFALLLILGGILFLSVQAGWVTGDMVWKYFMIGLGTIFIINGLAHYNNPDFNYFIYGKFVAGGVLLLVGILFITNYSIWWPVILIIGGCVVLIRLLLRKV